MHAETTVSEALYALANEPSLNIHSYPSCMVNGVRYHSRMRDERRTTQNCGICVEAELYDGDSCDFFGVIDEVWAVSYLYWNKVILFKCSWFDNNEKKKRTKKEYNFTSIRTDLFWFEEEPYALADQVKQVFYVDDNKNGESWKVVQKVNHRHILENTCRPLATDDGDEEDVDNDAYQEELSNEVDISFDTTNVEEAPLNRTDISPIEIDNLYIDLQIDPDGDDESDYSN